MMLRQIFGAEPDEVIEAKATAVGFESADPRVDEGMKATLKFFGGGVGKIDANLRRKGG